MGATSKGASNTSGASRPTGRRAPTQARAVRTFRRILEAASQILVIDGIPGLNTNRIAEEAGINVSTLYGYFSDKEEIVRTLASEFENERASWVEEHAGELVGDVSWEEWHCKIIDRMVEFRVASPGGLAVRRALLATPELMELDYESTDRSAEAQIAGMRAHSEGLSDDQLHQISWTVTQMITSLLDAAFRTDPYDAALIAETKTMAIAYLSQYLTPTS